MLKTLTVWNFALIEHAIIDFTEKLNIFTGETGAGKSILIGSLELLLGKRASADFIRTGADYLRVEAIFDSPLDGPVHSFLRDNAIVDDSPEVIVVRQVNRNGKNIIQINGCHVTLNILKSLGALLFDIHGQHDNQLLLSTGQQLTLLDNAIAENGLVSGEYKEAYEKYLSSQEKLKLALASSNKQRLEMLKWQRDEIENVNFKIEEFNALEEQIKKMTNFEKIVKHVNNIDHLLTSEDGVGVLSMLTQVQHDLAILTDYDEEFRPWQDKIEDIYLQAEECAGNLRSYIDRFEFNPTELDTLLSRRHSLERLCRKYGPTPEEVLSYYGKISEEIENIENCDTVIANLQHEVAENKQVLQKKAEKWRILRTGMAKKLSQKITAYLQDLGMKEGQFSIEVIPLDEFTPRGTENVQIMFSANRGEPLKPLQKIASGGELSRISLAVKTATAYTEPVETMIFDEIDTGIGGKTAQRVAERIASISFCKQVICITHLPQIAVMADKQFYIEKMARGSHTTTNIQVLAAGEQLHEIARMASGIDITAAALENAMEMLNSAKERKRELAEEP